MNTIKPLFIVTSLALLVSCGGGKSLKPTNLSLSSVLQTNHSAITSFETTIVKTQLEWQALWDRHTGALLPPALAVDFNANQVVGVFLGERPNGCYTVEITKILQSSSLISVYYKEQGPTPTSLCTQAIVYPVHLVKIAQSNLPIAFKAE